MWARDVARPSVVGLDASSLGFGQAVRMGFEFHDRKGRGIRPDGEAIGGRARPYP